MQLSSNNIYFDIKLIEQGIDSNKYRIIIKIPMKVGWIDAVFFHLDNGNGTRILQLKHYKNEDEYCYFENEITIDTSALYYYYFSYYIGGQKKLVTAKSEYCNQQINNSEKWKLSVNFNVPSWAKGKIMYHIFIDRFNRNQYSPLENMPRRHVYKAWNQSMRLGPDENNIWNNDFFGGNLQGIIDKLDYISSLGVKIIYLSPVVYSQSNHRYDAADYEKVDPYIGINADLKQLCMKAHAKGIKIILDAVFNHTGNDSKYFNEYGTFSELGAYQSDFSSYKDFYKMTYKDGKREFAYWWGMKNLPVCDGDSHVWQEYITGVNGIIDQWFNLGIDGLRLDVADELTDNFINLIRNAVKRNKSDGFILGEV